MSDTTQDIIDLSNGADDTKIWYVIPYQVIGGIWEAQVEDRKPTWTSDCRKVKTAAWYAGTDEDWRAHIAAQTLRALALPTAASYHESSR